MYLTNNNQSFAKFQLLQDQLTTENEKSKQIYYFRITKKLTNPSTTPRNYGQFWKLSWTSKSPCIHPIFHENKFIVDFKWKAGIFNDFFYTNLQH